jgi:hypothetical protein
MSMPPKPLVENLLTIDISRLPIPSTNDPKTYILPDVSLCWPHIGACKVSRDCVELHIPSLHRNQNGPVHKFRLKHIRVGYGIRHAFLCNDCGRPTFKLRYHNRHLACYRCLGAVYASQTCSQQQRPVLQATRIQSFLDSKPRLFHRTRERLRKRLGEKLLMAQTRLNTQASNPLE